MSVMLQFYSIIIYHGISAPGRFKKVVGGINPIYKCYIYQLMSNFQLTGSKTFEKHILIYSCTPKHYGILAKQFQIYISKEHRKHGVIMKRASKIKWTDREYHVQDNTDV